MLFFFMSEVKFRLHIIKRVSMRECMNVLSDFERFITHLLVLDSQIEFSKHKVKMKTDPLLSLVRVSREGQREDGMTLGTWKLKLHLSSHKMTS